MVLHLLFLSRKWRGTDMARADGATITLERGILKASRGMGNDLMGSTSMLPWSKIGNNFSSIPKS